MSEYKDDPATPLPGCKRARMELGKDKYRLFMEHFPGGNKLAYSTQEVIGYEGKGRGVIYVINFSLPINVQHKIVLENEHTYLEKKS